MLAGFWVCRIRAVCCQDTPAEGTGLRAHITITIRRMVMFFIITCIVRVSYLPEDGVIIIGKYMAIIYKKL